MALALNALPSYAEASSAPASTSIFSNAPMPYALDAVSRGARAADGDIPFTIQCISAVRIFPCLDIDCAVLHQNAALRSPDGVVPLRGVQAYLAVSQHHRGAGARTARTRRPRQK